jgi:hypothetical protein
LKKYLIIVSLLILGVIGYGGYLAFFDMNRLPKDNLIAEVKSPKGTYTIKAYSTAGGATVDYSVLGELNFNKENRKPKNIYWNYHESSAGIEWINENTVIINGHKLKVPGEVYDFRRH